ncbi:hypothetical protein AACH06_25335 [Ideonella sp. DXS29W]|uniref:Beta/gamma crystallin 'Greek key' domain-containing protein n=1 Tax=Ideonella lacteola TaxID=2984193 RepID=A0ABU9BW13_9BURK
MTSAARQAASRATWGAAIAGLLGLVIGSRQSAAAPPETDGHPYEAVLAQRSLIGGSFEADGRRWSCMGTLRRCQAILPEPVPTLRACQSLVSRTGAASAFGRVGGPALGAADLMVCNRQARPQPPGPSLR